MPVSPNAALLCALLLLSSAAAADEKKVTKVETSEPVVQDTSHYAVVMLQNKLPKSSAETFSLETVMSALSQPSKAEVIKTQTRDFLGMRIPMESITAELGTLYYLTLLTAHTSSSPLTRQLNPWPMWELTCAKVWQRSKAERSIVALVTPKRKAGIAVRSKPVQAAVGAAIGWLSEKQGQPATLLDVVGAESQELEVRHLHQLNTKHGKVDWGVESEVELYFVTLLARVAGAAATHMFAVQVPNQARLGVAGAPAPKIVAHFGGERPGLSVVHATALLNMPGCPVLKGGAQGAGGAPPVDSVCAKGQVRALRHGLASVSAWGGVSSADTVQVLSWQPASGQEADSAPRAFDRSAGANGARGNLVSVRFSVGVVGDGRTLLKALRSASTGVDVAKEMKKRGVNMADGGVAISSVQIKTTDATCSGGGGGGGIAPSSLRTAGQNSASGAAAHGTSGLAFGGGGWAFAAAMASVVAAGVVLGGMWLAHVGRLPNALSSPRAFVGQVSAAPGTGDPSTSYQQVKQGADAGM